MSDPTRKEEKDEDGALRIAGTAAILGRPKVGKSTLLNAIGHPYQRHLVNQLRQVCGFEGAPMRLALRAHRCKRKTQPRPNEEAG